MLNIVFYTKLTLLHSERPKLYAILVFGSAIELKSVLTNVTLNCFRFGQWLAMIKWPICLFFSFVCF